MTQFARPNSDISVPAAWTQVGGATTGTFYTDIDESVDAFNDADYIKITNNTEGKFGLSSVTQPAAGASGYSLNFAARADGGIGVNLVVNLYQDNGATLIATTGTVALPGGVGTTKYSYTLTSTDLAKINWAKSFQFGFVATNGSGLVIGRMVAFEFRVPDADTTPPVMTFTSGGKLSTHAGHDSVAYSITASEALNAWEIRIVPATNSVRADGVLVESGGALASGATATGTITYAELAAASQAAEGSKLAKVFGQDLALNWSAI